MKRFLVIGLLFVSSAVIAQTERPSRGCSVLIGRNWIPMSATSINGCFKFAEAAASPGERQIAAFGSSTLAFKNGQYFLSNDGGVTWVNAHPRQAQTAMSSLNKLPSSDDTAGAVKTGSNAAGVVPEPSSTPVPVQENAVASGAAEVQPSTPATVVPTQIQEDAFAPVEVPQSVPAASVQQAGSTQSAVVAGTPSATSRVLKVCQLKDAEEKWHRYLTATINECGAKLADVTVASGAKSGQAYWNRQYVFYSGGVVYQSSDGDRWEPLQ